MGSDRNRVRIVGLNRPTCSFAPTLYFFSPIFCSIFRRNPRAGRSCGPSRSARNFSAENDRETVRIVGLNRPTCSFAPTPYFFSPSFLFDFPTEPSSGPIVRSVPIGPELLGPGAGPEAGAQRSLETVESDRSRTHSRPRPTNLFVRPCTRARAVTSKIDPRTWVGGRIGLRPRSRHCRYAAW